MKVLLISIIALLCASCVPNKANHVLIYDVYYAENDIKRDTAISDYSIFLISSKGTNRVSTLTYVWFLDYEEKIISTNVPIKPISYTIDGINSPVKYY